jgi:hypothetical protein
MGPGSDVSTCIVCLNRSRGKLMKTRHHRLAALVAAGTLTFSVAACGSDADDPAVEPDTTTTASQEPDQAAETTDDAAATTGDAASEDSGGDAAEGEEIGRDEFLALLKSSGAEELGSYTIEMNLTSNMESMTMAGAADMRGEFPLMRFTMSLSDMGEIEVIMADGDFLMTMPELGAQGQWMRVSPEELDMDLDELTGSIDLDSTFDAWDAGVTRVVRMGQEDVGGEPMQRYSVEVDAAAAFAAQGDEVQPGMPDTIVYDVWLDGQNLMRKVTFDLGGAGGTAVEILVDNWGEDVDIELPDESQIMDLTG